MTLYLSVNYLIMSIFSFYFSIFAMLLCAIAIAFNIRVYYYYVNLKKACTLIKRSMGIIRAYCSEDIDTAIAIKAASSEKTDTQNACLDVLVVVIQLSRCSSLSESINS